MPVLQNIYSWAASQTRLKDSMFFEEGKAWGRSRRLISPNLNGHNVAGMLPIMAKVTRLVIVTEFMPRVVVVVVVFT